MVERAADDSHRLVRHPLLSSLGRDTRELQRALAAAIPGASVHEAPGGHASVVFDVERWRPVFLAAVADVVGQLTAAG